jgi:hypothetical protein
MTRADFREIAQATRLLPDAEAWRLILVLLAERGVSQRRLCKVRQLVWAQRQLLGPSHDGCDAGGCPRDDFLGRTPET